MNLSQKSINGIGYVALIETDKVGYSFQGMRKSAKWKVITSNLTTNVSGPCAVVKQSQCVHDVDDLAHVGAFD